MTTNSLTGSQTLEDWILFLGPLLSAGAGTSLSGIISGTNGFLLGIVIAALGKSLLGLSFQTKSLEDWLLFISTFLGLVATALTANSQFVLYGTIIGFAAKSIPSLVKVKNVEDVFLLIGSIIAFLGVTFGNTNVENTGLLLLTMGKALPSIATNGAAGTTSWSQKSHQ